MITSLPRFGYENDPNYTLGLILHHLPKNGFFVR